METLSRFANDFVSDINYLGANGSKFKSNSMDPESLHVARAATRAFAAIAITAASLHILRGLGAIAMGGSSITLALGILGFTLATDLYKMASDASFDTEFLNLNPKFTFIKNRVGATANGERSPEEIFKGCTPREKFEVIIDRTVFKSLYLKVYDKAATMITHYYKKKDD